MLVKIKNYSIFISLLLMSKFANAAADSDIFSKMNSNADKVSSSLAKYLSKVAVNLNDFVIVGFLMVCTTAAISLLFTQENVVKALSKVAFGLFLLKSSATILLAIVK